MFGLKLPPTTSEYLAIQICEKINNNPCEIKKIVLERLLDNPHVDKEAKKGIKEHECFQGLLEKSE